MTNKTLKRSLVQVLCLGNFLPPAVLLVVFSAQYVVSCGDKSSSGTNKKKVVEKPVESPNGDNENKNKDELGKNESELEENNSTPTPGSDIAESDPEQIDSKDEIISARTAIHIESLDEKEFSASCLQYEFTGKKAQVEEAIANIESYVNSPDRPHMSLRGNCRGGGQVISTVETGVKTEFYQKVTQYSYE